MEIISKNKIFAENYKSFLLKNLLIIEKNNKTSFCLLEDKKESLYYYYNYKTVKLNKNLNTKKHILSINEYYDIDEFILENKLTKGLLKNYLNLINNIQIDKKKSLRFFKEIKHRNFRYLVVGQSGQIFLLDKKKTVWWIKQKPKRTKQYKQRFQYKNFRNITFKYLAVLPIPKNCF